MQHGTENLDLKLETVEAFLYPLGAGFSMNGIQCDFLLLFVLGKVNQGLDSFFSLRITRRGLGLIAKPFKTSYRLL